MAQCESLLLKMVIVKISQKRFQKKLWIQSTKKLACMCVLRATLSAHIQEKLWCVL